MLKFSKTIMTIRDVYCMTLSIVSFRLRDLAMKLEVFHVMLDSLYGIEGLEKNPLPEGKKWSVFLKVDCGKKRSTKILL